MSEKSQQIMINISTLTILKIIGFFLLLWFLYIIKDILIILFVSILFATAFNPFVDWLNKKKIPRALGVLIIYFILLSILFTVIVLLIPPLSEQIRQISQTYPSLWQRFLDIFPGSTSPINSGENIQSFFESLRDIFANKSLSNIFTLFGSAFDGLISFILIFVLTFYFLVEEEAIKKAFHYITPPQYIPYLNNLITRIQDRMGKWLRGELILMIVVGCMTLIGLKILQVKYFLVLALIAAIFELIPYLGPILAAIPAIIIASVESLWKGIAVIILYWLIQQLENHIIVPKVMQKVIGLNPIIVILVILIGARLAGFIGIMVSVPAAAALSVIIKNIFGKET